MKRPPESELKKRSAESELTDSHEVTAEALAQSRLTSSSPPRPGVGTNNLVRCHVAAPLLCPLMSRCPETEHDLFSLHVAAHTNVDPEQRNRSWLRSGW